MESKIEKSWRRILENEFEKAYFHKLKSFLTQEKKKYLIFPEARDIFNAFNLTPFHKLKVVIIGQDPYHGLGQAHGLAFSVPKGIKTPPSLKNIFKELSDDIGTDKPKNGNLTHWAKQGVLLLNTILSVREKDAGSHQRKGWEKFTDKIIKEISNQKKGVVFILWGKSAQQKSILINKHKHHLLTAPHPSPFSAYNGFFGCKHFSKTNEILTTQNQQTIDWVL